MEGRRLTALENSFLALERPGLGMHVGGVLILEPGRPITLHELANHVRPRLRRLPRFHEEPRSGGLGLRRPEWVRARRTELGEHLFHHRLAPPGNASQLDAECAAIHEQRLPRDRPLWQIHLVDGLAGHRQAILVKTHHSITDGIAGVEVALALFDPAPGADRRHALPAPHFADGPAALPLAAARAVLGAAFTAAAGPLAIAGPFNGRVGSRRAFATAALPMSEIRIAKQRIGGSVDDVLIAVVAAGLRDHLRSLHCEPLPHALKAMLPVATRASTGKPVLGNHVSAVFIDLPLDVDDFAELVRAVATAKSNLRVVHAAAGVGMLLEAAGLLPHPLHDELVRGVGSLPFANLVLSDVPGPEQPLFLMGRRVEGCYPLMPLPPKTGLSIAAVSMGGTMGVGITADPDLVPSPRRLARAIRRALPRFATATPRGPAASPHAASTRAA